MNINELKQNCERELVRLDGFANGYKTGMEYVLKLVESATVADVVTEKPIEKANG